MALDTHPIDAAFGREVRGVTLSALSAAEIEQIATLLREHGLLLFRRQLLDDQQIVDFTAHFGPVELAVNANARSPVTDRLYYISNLKNAEGEDIGQLGMGELEWHSDYAFRLKPATLSVLYGLQIPPKGGDTLFCSTVLGYEALPPHLKQRVAGLRGVYQPSHRNTVDTADVSHPLALRHPGGERHSLYLSQSAQALEGLPEDEGRALMAELLNHQLRGEHVYRHRWQMGDVVMYDNGQMLHKREAYEGVRLMKATRAYLDPERFPVPTQGEVSRHFREPGTPNPVRGPRA